jgi:two-component system, NarL family, nitrate/nitrite response regulator NarL
VSEGLDVLIVDDHALLGLGLQGELRRRGLTAELGETVSADALLAQVAERRPSLVVLDIMVPGVGGGRAVLPMILAHGSSIVMLTGTVDTGLWGTCIEAGALAVLSKDEPLTDIFDAIVAAVDGRPVRPGRSAALVASVRRERSERQARLAPFALLTPREQRVLAALMTGASVGGIAREDYVTVDTVRSHVKSLLRKLRVSSQLEAVALANQAGWTPTVARSSTA